MKDNALTLLREMTANHAAEFHEGQLEAILQLVEEQSKLLVVQKTGWGKSAVYFIATKLLRLQGKGPTIIISPLIALMRNQVERAGELGLSVVSINSAQSEQENDEAKQLILSRQIDALIISPEQLANDELVENVLNHILSNIGLFVVDEAHCISDWGHDFRPDYRRIVRLLNRMPANIPILATTATATTRVITDINRQLGDDLQVIRGDLKRQSLYLQNMPSAGRSARMAWLAEYIPQLEGTGIVYVKTIRDGELLAEWLRYKGIHASFYNGNSNNELRIRLEDALLSNKLKVLVATSALGMGFDKPDLGFVIHFQLPGSIVEYYQQVGRAGRAIEHAYGVLMDGPESEKIQDYFINNAFPSEEEIEQVLTALEQSDGVKDYEIERLINLSVSRIRAVLKFLTVENPSPIYKDSRTKKYFRNEQNYSLPTEHIEHITAIKKREWNQLRAYHNATNCLMKELTFALDDPLTEDCGNCMNCTPNRQLLTEVSEDVVKEALEFSKYRYIKISPRKKFAISGAMAKNAFPHYGFPIKDSALQAAEGLALSSWRDGAWGDLVAHDKGVGHFSDDLLEPMVTMVKSMEFDEKPQWLTYIPSLRNPELVKSFAYRLAEKLGIPCREALVMVEKRPPQKTMQNSFRQSSNLDGVFTIDGKQGFRSPVLLLDDAVDSGWTFTVAAALLRRAGAVAVYPIALTSTSKQNQGE
ncbi:RecQ family ATP-dependent DNA helicase [bacterium]|nr:RecQ family ATP-dependent DNA helicase [bacterium]